MKKSYLSLISDAAAVSSKPTKTFRLLLMVLFVGLCTNIVNAQKTWDGGAGTINWGDAANWNPDGLPTSIDAVTLTNDTAVTVNISTAICASLQLGGTVINTRGIINFSTIGSPRLNVVGAVTMGGSNGNVSQSGNITFANGSTLICGSLTLGNINNSVSTLTMSANSTLQTGSLSVRGTGTKTWTPSTGTVVLTTNNTLPATVFNSFNNLTINAGTTIFGAATTIANNLSINAGAIANLGTFTHSAGTLQFAGVAQVPESFGSTISRADNKNDTYFSATAGIVNNSCISPVITTQPISLTICENSGGSFTVAPNTAGQTYQWQYSLNNINWLNTNGLLGVSGNTSASLSLTNTSAAYNGYLVRCIVRSSGGCRTNSNAVLLTVNGPPATTETITQATCNASDGAITITGLENIPIEFKKADNDYIDLRSAFLSNRNSFTVEGWVKFNIADVGSRMSLFGQNDVIEFFLNNNRIELYTNGGGSINTPLTVAFGNNTWHHIAATGNGTNLRLYIDGTMVAIGGLVTTNYGSSIAYNAQIGSGVVDPLTTLGGGFTGQIKKVGFYSTALSAATILSLASNPVTYLGTETGLIAGYNFTEGSGTTLTRLPAGTNGSLTNTPQWIFYTYSWTKTGTPSYTASTKNISGLSSGIYNLSIGINGLSCSKVTSYSVSPTNIYTTSWSLGVPTPNQNIEFTGSYNILTDITACSCTITSGTVTIPSGNYLKLGGKLTVNTPGTLTFENNASLVQTTFTGANTGDITYKRTTTTNRELDYTYWSSPVASQNLLAVSPTTKSDKFYSFDANTDNWFQETPSTTTMTIGKGYIIRGIPPPPPPSPPGFSTSSFVGQPNNGTITISGIVADKSYLLGNPYPSALDADTFILENAAAIDGALYFWTHNTPIAIGTPDPGTGTWAYSGNDYATYTLSGGVGTAAGNFIDANRNGIMDSGEEVISNRPTGKIAAGQGFFTTSISANDIKFKNSMRVDGLENPIDNSKFYKTKNPKQKNTTTIEKNRVWLNLTNKEGAFKQTLVGYLTGASDTWDNLFDGISFDGNDFIDFYSINDEKNLTIQGRALPFVENDEVPLGYRIAEASSLTVSIDETDGELANQDIFIDDKLTNKTINLKEEKYTFSTEEGTFDDRFVLRYTNKTLATKDFDSLENNVLVSVKNKQIKINAFTETIEKVTIYDLLGRQIYQKEKINSNEVSVSNLVSSHQTLIVKTILQNGKTVTNKVIY